jgi:hypothetical protein
MVLRSKTQRSLRTASVVCHSKETSRAWGHLKLRGGPKRDSRQIVGFTETKQAGMIAARENGDKSDPCFQVISIG